MICNTCIRTNLEVELNQVLKHLRESNKENKILLEKRKAQLESEINQHELERIKNECNNGDPSFSELRQYCNLTEDALEEIAKIAHEGGRQGMDANDALVRIRRLSLPWREK